MNACTRVLRTLACTIVAPRRTTPALIPCLSCPGLCLVLYFKHTPGFVWGMRPRVCALCIVFEEMARAVLLRPLPALGLADRPAAAQHRACPPCCTARRQSWRSLPQHCSATAGVTCGSRTTRWARYRRRRTPGAHAHNTHACLLTPCPRGALWAPVHGKRVMCTHRTGDAPCKCTALRLCLANAPHWRCALQLHRTGDAPCNCTALGMRPVCALH